MTCRSNTADENASTSTCLLLIIVICSSLIVYYQVGDELGIGLGLEDRGLDLDLNSALC